MVLCRVLATVHISCGMPVLKRRKMLKKKKGRAHSAKFSSLKMATLSVETYFLSCASTSVFDVAAFSLCHRTHTRPETDNSEFNKLHYRFHKSCKFFRHLKNKLTSYIPLSPIFIPPQKRWLFTTLTSQTKFVPARSAQLDRGHLVHLLWVWLSSLNLLLFANFRAIVILDV